MTGYQGYPIANFRTGFNEALEPWLLPRDAFQSLINAHLYRGVLEKIQGYNPYAKMTYRHQQAPVAQPPDGVRVTFTGTLSPVPISSNITAYGTIVPGVSAEIFSYSGDASATVINLTGSANGTGTVNIVTGAYSITFNTPPPAGTYSCVYISWDSATGQTPGTGTAIMGIKPYYAENGSQEILVFNQKRVGKVVTNNGMLADALDADYVVSEIPHAYYESQTDVLNGTVGPFAGTLATAPFERNTVTFFQFTVAGAPVNIVSNGLFVGQNVTDNGFGGLQGPDTLLSAGLINYVTGAYTMTFTVAPPNNNYLDATVGVYGDLFNGSISNFFSLVNFQFKAFFCNGLDKIFYYDGNTIQYLPANLETKVVTAVAGVPPYDISSTLHITADRFRLILLSPTVENVPRPDVAYWSVVLNSLDFTNDEQVYASTSQPIRTFSFINSDIVVRFSNSERVLRYTGDENQPFRWDKTNNAWQCDAPYTALNYDTYYTSVGKPGIVGSDGVNVKRVDEIIPDFTDPYRLVQELPVPFMNQTSIQQCYGERFDDIKEGWICYNSAPNAENSVTASDSVLSFNYLDNTYAVYEFPFSCLGRGTIFQQNTWGDTWTPWGQMLMAWGSYQINFNSLVDLGGDQYNWVYQLNIGNTLTLPGDATTTPSPVLFSAITKNFNPYIEQGELARLGYVDLFVSANGLSKLRVQFYLNDQLYIDSNGDPAGYYQETTLTFEPKDGMSPTTDQTKVWKRIYVGATGKEHTIRFYQNPADFTSETLDQPIFIHAMVPYFKPAGRIFN